MKKLIRFVVFFLFLSLAAVLVSLLLSSHALTVSQYAVVCPEINTSIRVVHLSDLHNSEFGENNKRLIEKVAAQDPDLILISGDLLNYNEERTDVAVELIKGLASAAPVYVSYGNHESAYEKRYGTDLAKLYTEAGATVLELSWQDITIKGQPLRIGGIFGYCLPSYISDARVKDTRFLESFQETDAFSILLCHMPLCWIKSGSLDAWDIDCVLSGHVHGGQIRLPWIGGLWAPDQGWFPGRECGLYWSKDGTKFMALSRGLGNTESVPRLNNIPEILVLDLNPM